MTAATKSALVAALKNIKQELWVDFCLGLNNSHPPKYEEERFDSKPVVRIIIDALALAEKDDAKIILCGDHAQFEIDNAGVAPKDRSDWPLPSFDARDWAAHFCKLFPGSDEGLMLTWFANALMRGFDEARARPPTIRLTPEMVEAGKHGAGQWYSTFPMPKWTVHEAIFRAMGAAGGIKVEG